MATGLVGTYDVVWSDQRCQPGHNAFRGWRQGSLQVDSHGKLSLHSPDYQQVIGEASPGMIPSAFLRRWFGNDNDGMGRVFFCQWMVFFWQ